MAQAHAHTTEGPHAHHIIPRSTLLKVFGGLIVLTVITVLTAQINLGAFNVPLALAIASAKAALVITFFMALKYDKRVNLLVFIVGALFVLIFLTFTVFDVAFRGDMPNVERETIMDQQIEEEALRSRQQSPLPTPGGATGAAGAAAAGAVATDSADAAADTAATAAPQQEAPQQ